jgi:hypothetical protein
VKPAYRASVDPFVRPAFLLLVPFFPTFLLLQLFPCFLGFNSARCFSFLFLLDCLFALIHHRYNLQHSVSNQEHSYALSLVQPRQPVCASQYQGCQNASQQTKRQQENRSRWQQDKQAAERDEC